MLFIFSSDAKFTRCVLQARILALEDAVRSRRPVDLVGGTSLSSDQGSSQSEQIKTLSEAGDSTTREQNEAVASSAVSELSCDGKAESGECGVETVLGFSGTAAEPSSCGPDLVSATDPAFVEVLLCKYFGCHATNWLKVSVLRERMGALEKQLESAVLVSRPRRTYRLV